MTEFYEYWNNVLKEWRTDGKIPTSQAFWFEEQKHLKLHPNLMPEPYWGDIDNNSVVFVNLNPAGSETEIESDDSHISQKNDSQKICGLMSPDYGRVAKSFPLLEWDEKVYKGVKWWKNRVKWLEQFDIADKDLQPFAIELCPWHSRKWCGAKYEGKRKTYTKTNDYLKNMFGPWLERAIKGSKYHLALCIGKEFPEKIIPRIWQRAEDITESVAGKELGKEPWCPINGNAREFRVFRIPDVGHIICTSVQGSNHIPSTEFGEFEREILEKIQD